MTENRPRALDLFCKAGGVTKGLQRAGFYVVGVDIEPQPRYCGDEFMQADALTVDLSGFDFVWASPVCKGYSITRHIWPDREHPDQIAETRVRLAASGIPWIIENVAGSPLINPVMLCGQMVGLPHLYRHRYFESNLAFLTPPHPKHAGYTNASRGYSSFDKGATVISLAGHNFKREDGALATGIDWMTRPELAQAIPPAYSEFLGRQVMNYLIQRNEAAA